MQAYVQYRNKILLLCCLFWSANLVVLFIVLSLLDLLGAGLHRLLILKIASHSRSFKVIRNDTDEQRVCNVLLVIHMCLSCTVNDILYRVFQKKVTLTFLNIFTTVESFCVKFSKYVGSAYPHIFTNFCRFILIFHQMALLFPRVPIVFTLSSFEQAYSPRKCKCSFS